MSLLHQNVFTFAYGWGLWITFRIDEAQRATFARPGFVQTRLLYPASPCHTIVVLVYGKEYSVRPSRDIVRQTSLQYLALYTVRESSRKILAMNETVHTFRTAHRP
jgi:hypothetical protein